ncbi:hypothetical protein NEOLEDRAFT_1039517, partial [Neolentinus lepideus HHB14362 ss-1]
AQVRKSRFCCTDPTCAQICNSQSDLKRHLQSLKHNDKEYRCERCGDWFTRIDAMIRHCK